MSKSRTRPARGIGRAIGRRSLIAVAAAPLVAFHIAMLVMRLTQESALDAAVVARWGLALVLLLCLRRAKAQLVSTQRPLGLVAALLIFALIHAPTTSPDPAQPLVITGLGLALAMAFVDPARAPVPAPIRAPGRIAWPSGKTGFEVALESLKDRAPPTAA